MVAICLLGLVQPVALVAAEISADSSRIAMRHLEEVTIVCNPKVESDLFYMPSSVTLIGSESLQEMHTSSIKDLSTIASNLFIPDYGSRLITSAYIRGIGSRINSPAVGMSVDNVCSCFLTAATLLATIFASLCIAVRFPAAIYCCSFE